MSDTIPVVKVGDRVFYVPHLDHHLDCDHRGDPLFRFEFARHHNSRHLACREGDPVSSEAFGRIGRPGRGNWRRLKEGIYQTGGGATVRLVGPGKPWPAIVREVFADGTVALDIAHPLGGSLQSGHDAFVKGAFIVLHYPSRGAAHGLPYSKDFVPHSWHLLEDGKAVS